KGGVFLDTNALSLAPGVYYTSGSGIASLVGPPQVPPVARYQGVLEVLSGTGAMRLYRWTVVALPPGVVHQTWEIVYDGTAWGKWHLTSSMNTPGSPLMAVSLDANAGTYQVNSAETIASLGLPGG